MSNGLFFPFLVGFLFTYAAMVTCIVLSKNISNFPGKKTMCRIIYILAFVIGFCLGCTKL